MRLSVDNINHELLDTYKAFVARASSIYNVQPK